MRIINKILIISLTGLKPRNSSPCFIESWKFSKDTCVLLLYSLPPQPLSHVPSPDSFPSAALAFFQLLPLAVIPLVWQPLHLQVPPSHIISQLTWYLYFSFRVISLPLKIFPWSSWLGPLLHYMLFWSQASLISKLITYLDFCEIFSV